MSGDRWHENFTGLKDCLRNLIQISEDMELDMVHYKDFIHQRKAQHEHLLSQIYNLAKRNEDIVKQLKAEDRILTDTLREGTDHRKRATDTLSKYYRVMTAEEVAGSSDEVGGCCDTLEEWRRRSQMQLPNAKTIVISDRLLRDVTAALKEITPVDQDSARTTVDLSASKLTFMDKIKRITGEATLPLTILQERSESIRNSIEKGYLYAIQNDGGRTRSARITMSNNKIYLHFLQDVEPPVYAHTLKHSELIGSLHYESLMAFMDLSWEGSVRGRLHIVLSPDSPMARHFRLLCCGDLGPTYANSLFHWRRFMGNDTHERIIGGDYEFGDGKGGAPLMSGLSPDDGIYSRKYEAGIVFVITNENDGPLISQFGILTGKGSNIVIRGVFGHVQEGLETVRAAAKLDDIRQVSITDCGVILSF